MGALLQRSGGAGDEGSRAGSAEPANPVLAGAARAFSDLVTVTRLRAAPHTSLPDVSHRGGERDRKSTRLNSSHGYISYAVFCLKKKKKIKTIYLTIITSKNILLMFCAHS